MPIIKQLAVFSPSRVLLDLDKERKLELEIGIDGQISVNLHIEPDLEPLQDDSLSSTGIRLDFARLMAEAEEVADSIWHFAQKELARQLLLLTATDKNGKKVSQLVQGELLGIDRAYISRLKKELKIDT